MKYNLDDLHWQEFEVLSFKVLQILVAQNVQLLEGGNDKGRDAVYEGISPYNNSFNGRWVFQIKHKSKINTETELASTLIQDLKSELQKVFVTNKLLFDNYILVTNKSITPTLFDKLHDTFLEFKGVKKIDCKSFDIISYRQFESCIENSNVLKWLYPNIINHPDFLLLLKDANNFYLENRKRGWLNGLKKQRVKFVYTQFFQKAFDKLKEFPAIILSGPPKSGKTFNAEILALNFSVLEDYQPILIDNPDEIESAFEFERKQIFICDDAFGKYALSYRAEDWFNKLDRIFNLADSSHLFIFTSKEYIFRAFLNFGDDNAKSLLEKIMVESHNYSSQEKLAILKRYTTLSPLSEFDKSSILYNELVLTSHRSFSPETIRAFFANIDDTKSGTQLEAFRDHLDKPDIYLSTVFQKLSQSKKAVLLSVLCTVENSQDSIYKTFNSICDDLKIDAILNSNLEFYELDDSILRINKTDRIEDISFYHPSMQEFLTRQLINNESAKLREVVIKNLNSDLLSLSRMKSLNKSIFKTSKDETIELNKKDVATIQTGLDRLVSNENASLYQVAFAFNWFKLENHALDLKLNDAPFFKGVKEVIARLLEKVSSEDFYLVHKNESNSAWSNFLLSVKNVSVLYGLDINSYEFIFIETILKDKAQEEYYWILVMRTLNFKNDEFVKNLVGKEWLNNFYKEIKNSVYALGHEIFGTDFPDFEEYNRNRQKRIPSEKLKQKPNRDWYPRFLNVKDKMDVLKEIKGTSTANIILERLSKPYEEIIKWSEFAKNRHTFILKKGWWKE